MPRQQLSAICLAILTIILVFTVLRYGKDIFAPVLSAMVLGVVLTPMSDLWERLRIPPALAAFISVTLALLSLFILALLIEPYVSEAISKAPVIWQELRSTIDQLRYVLRGLEQVSEDMAQAIEPTAGTATEEKDEAVVSLPTLTDALFYAPQFAGQFLVFAGTLYFFLMTQNEIYNWTSKTFDRFGEDDLRNAAGQVARYVLTITTINFGFGVLVTIAMHLIGVPSPIIWGVLAFSLNFVMYLGPIMVISALLVTGIVVFDGALSFAPAAIYMSMNAVESQFITPTMVGRTLSVTPLTVFLSLVFWLWLWGPIGGVIAIPLLVWSLAIVKAVLSHSKDTARIIQPSAVVGK